MVCAAWAYYEQETALESEGDDIVSSAFEQWAERSHERQESLRQQGHGQQHPHDPLQLLSHFKMLFETLLDLSVDPNTDVALMASTVVDYVVALLLDSAFCRVQGSAILRLSRPTPARQPTQLDRPPPALSRTQTESSTHTLKRNTSMAGALRSLATTTGWTTEAEQLPTPPRTPTEPVAPAAEAYKSPYPDANHERIMPTTSIASQMQLRKAGFGHNTVSAVAVLDALTEEDMDRLRIRRAKGAQAGGDATGRFSNNGLPGPTDLGLGMVAKEVKDDVVPLRSGLYDEAMEYFKEPQMKAPDADDPGSLEFNRQAWRHHRNEVLVETIRAAEEWARESPFLLSKHY